MMKPLPAPQNAPAARTYLEAEARLEQMLALTTTSQTVSELLERIQRRTGVALLISNEARAYRALRLGMTPDTVSCRALLDALAALELYRWVRVDERRYELREPDRTARTPARQALQSAVAQSGLALRDEFAKLKPESQQKLASGTYVPFASLPTGIRKAIAALVEARNQEEASGRRETVPLSMRDVEVGEVAFQTETLPNRTHYRLFYRYRYDADGNMKSGAILFDDASERAARRAASSEAQAEYVPVRYEVAPKDAKERPELQRLVSLNARNMTYAEAAARLCGLAKVPALYIIERSARRSDLSIPRLPLGEALDRLADRFPDNEWELRRMGYLIVREPGNAARRST
jgi:hypothetical protein